MTIQDGKIVEATDSELFEYYLTRDWDLVMSYQDYKRECKERGLKVVDEEAEA